LKKGSKVDALKVESVGQERVEAWSQGTVRDIDTENILLDYDGVPLTHEPYIFPIFYKNRAKFSKSSLRIAPRGFRTADWGWRAALKSEDLVDIFDTQGHWFLGTVMKIQTNKDGFKEAVVAYRVYFPEGTKKDKNNKSHEGWSEQYDEPILLNSIRLQKPNSITKLGTVYCRRNLDNEYPAPDDSNDILINYPINTDKLYVIHRAKRNYSSAYLELVNEFAKNGGFDVISKYVNEKLSSLSINELFAYLEFISAPSNLYHRKFVLECITPFIEAVLRYMTSIPDEHLRSVKPKSLENALTHIDLLMRRVYTAKTKGEQSIKLKVGIALSLLRSPLLERRIQAIRIIAEICKLAKSSQVAAYYSTLPTVNDSTVLKGLLQVTKVIEEIFGKKSHIQLIQRSTEILSYFLMNGGIGKAELDVIWACCEQDEQYKFEILKVISETCEHLQDHLKGYIIDKYVKLPKNQFKDQDIELIYKMGNKNIKTPLDLYSHILELMWDLIIGEIKGISSSIYQKVFDRFCDVITSPTVVPEENMQFYFDHCYIMLKENFNPLLAYKVLRISLFQLPLQHRFKNKYDMVTSYLEKGQVIPNLFIDLERYHKFASEKLRNNVFNLNEHNEELRERMDFLLFVMNSSMFRFDIPQLKIIWDLLVLNPITQQDQIQFYRIFNENVFFLIVKIMKRHMELK